MAASDAQNGSGGSTIDRRVVLQVLRGALTREDAARAFAGEQGGKVVRIAELSDDYLFDPGAPGEEGSNEHATH